MAGADLPGCLGQGATIWSVTGNVPDALLEKCFGIGKCFRLDILGQGQGNCSGFRRTGQYAHGLRERDEQLFRAYNPIPITADWLKTIVDRDILSMFRFQLLQDRRDVPTSKEISRKKQDRQAVNRRGS